VDGIAQMPTNFVISPNKHSYLLCPASSSVPYCDIRTREGAAIGFGPAPELQGRVLARVRHGLSAIGSGPAQASGG